MLTSPLPKPFLELRPLRTDVVRPAKGFHPLLVTPLRGLCGYADGLIHGGHYTHCDAYAIPKLRPFCNIYLKLYYSFTVSILCAIPTTRKVELSSLKLPAKARRPLVRPATGR